MNQSKTTNLDKWFSAHENYSSFWTRWGDTE